jgi:hypothetical protein
MPTGLGIGRRGEAFFAVIVLVNLFLSSFSL